VPAAAVRAVPIPVSHTHIFGRLANVALIPRRRHVRRGLRAALRETLVVTADAV
jgi:hypothetical protein